MFNLGMTTSEFISYLREQACKWKMPPHYIIKLDELTVIADLPDELEELQDEILDLQRDKNNLSEALRDLLEACPEPEADPGYDAVIVICKAALERSGTK